MTVYYFSLLIITYGDYVPPAVLARYLTLSFIFRDGRAALPPHSRAGHRSSIVVGGMPSDRRCLRKLSRFPGYHHVR